MIRLFMAETRKLLTIRSTYALLLFTILATAGVGVAVALAPHQRGVEALLFPAKGTPAWYDTVFSSLTIAQDLALVLGIMIVTGEFRHRTATPTFLTEPRRERVAAAKLILSGVSGVVVAGAAALAGLILGLIFVASGYGSAAEMFGRLGHVLPGVIGATVLFGMYGVGLGALLKNQVLALVVGLGLSAVVEPIITAAWPGVGRWLPNDAARSLETTSDVARSGFGAGLGHLLPTWEGVAVLVAYILVLSVGGSFITLKADIT